MTKEIATLAGGCFWCTEAIYQRLKGVQKVTPGYSGGEMQNPSYEAVSSGESSHAEAIQIEFDPIDIDFKKILDVFWATHDPTTLNQQGADYGTQYRSVIFYHGQKQKEIAEKSLQEAQKSGMYKNRFVTDIVPFKTFYEAEDYHKNYYENNKLKPYCQIVIDPKIKKLLEKFPQNIAK